LNFSGNLFSIELQGEVKPLLNGRRPLTAFIHDAVPGLPSLKIIDRRL